jgi:hypothetical protein
MFGLFMPFRIRQRSSLRSAIFIDVGLSRGFPREARHVLVRNVRAAARSLLMLAQPS